MVITRQCAASGTKTPFLKMESCFQVVIGKIFLRPTQTCRSTCAYLFSSPIGCLAQCRSWTLLQRGTHLYLLMPKAYSCQAKSGLNQSLALNTSEKTHTVSKIIPRRWGTRKCQWRHGLNRTQFPSIVQSIKEHIRKKASETP